MPFTVVFEGQISKLDGNPLKYETAFGKVIACGIGNAFDELEQMHSSAERLEESLDIVRAIFDTSAWPGLTTFPPLPTPGPVNPATAEPL